jgi:hypothetical protein
MARTSVSAFERPTGRPSDRAGSPTSPTETRPTDTPRQGPPGTRNGQQARTPTSPIFSTGRRQGAWWAPRSSKPVWGRELPGGFDSRPPPQRCDQRRRASGRNTVRTRTFAPRSLRPCAPPTAGALLSPCGCGPALPAPGEAVTFPERNFADVLSARWARFRSDRCCVTDHPVGSSRQAAQVANCRPRRTVA